MNESELAVRLRTLRSKLAEASGAYPQPKILAVTKTRTPDEILPLAELGVDCIGENRVQEALEKLPALGDRFQLHMIGRLQRNKVRQIVPYAALIQSVDSLPLLTEVNRQAEKIEKRQRILIQVSPAGEPQKGGVDPAELPSLLREAAAMPAVEVRGLMAVMPDTEDQAYLMRLFRAMRELFDRMTQEAPDEIFMTELSMGMSQDCLLAATCGATMVRVGSALFGPREV